MELDRPLSRRHFLAAGVITTTIAAAGATASNAAPRQAPVTLPPPPIHPRSEWGGDLPPRGPMLDEAAGDVRFLVIHHSETPNDYSPEDVAPRLRSIFDYHTAAKGWPDVAYNFFVDAFGGIWEGRTGSIERPVRGDATGGSQGFAMLCCFLGDHTATVPTEPAIQAMATLNAWLATTYGIDLRAGPAISFVSRGSNRWPAGTTVTTDPIAGHRDMSQTACPGDAAYPLVRGPILERAEAIVATATPTTTAPTSTTDSRPPSVADQHSEAAVVTDRGSVTLSTGLVNPVTITGATLAAAGAIGAALHLRRRRTPH